MKFGMLVIPSAAKGTSFPEAIAQCIEQAEIAEANGFDFCLVPEHHQSRGFIPSSLLVAAAIASRTTTLRIGTGISLIGLKHPMQVVEEFHSLDAISGGRAIAGVGMGYWEQDFTMFGLKVNQRPSRFEDALNVLKQARTERSINYVGRRTTVDNVKVMPPPTQPGGVPIWMGSSSDKGVERAGKFADSLFIDQLTDTDRAVEMNDIYQKSAAEHGNKVSLILQRHTAIADSKMAAQEIIEPPVMRTLRSYWEKGAPDLSTAWQTAKQASDIVFDDFQHRFVYGNADDCEQSIRAWEQHMQVDMMLPLFHTATGPTHDVVCEQLCRFGSEVIPRFA